MCAAGVVPPDSPEWLKGSACVRWMALAGCLHECDAAAQVLRLLLTQGTWVDRTALNHLTTCQPALDDVLAGLVIDGHAEFKKFAGHGCAAGPRCARPVCS